MSTPRYRPQFHELGRMVHRLPTDMTLEQQAAELRLLFQIFCPRDKPIGLNAASSVAHLREGQRSTS
mgnify:CR=1 FL=1|jgi:hypothetical protein